MKSKVQISKKNQGIGIIHHEISPVKLVIPGLTRNPVFSWIPAFAGMTTFGAINVWGFWALTFL